MPRAALTAPGPLPALTFGGAGYGRGPVLRAHSCAVRGFGDGRVIGADSTWRPHEVGRHSEVQVGELENRTTTSGSPEFTHIYYRWHRGELERASARRRDRQRLLTDTCRCSTDLRMLSRRRRIQRRPRRRSHGAAIRLASAFLLELTATLRLDNHRTTPNRWCWPRSPTGVELVRWGA